MADERDVRPPRIRIQGREEEIAYGLDASAVGSIDGAITNPATTAWLLISGEETTDVSTSVLSGSPSVTDQIITTPKVKSLIEGSQYRIKTKFNKDGLTLVGRFEVHCPDD